MDRLDAMKTFVRVAQSNSFAAVAVQLDVARSVITRQIAALENHLRVKLIARSTRRLSLTAEGVEYLDKCREILDLVEDAESNMTKARSAPRGHIRVSVPVAFGMHHLMPIFTDFTSRFPETRIEIDLTDRRTNLIEQGFDLAVRVLELPEDTSVVRKLCICRSAVVASPKYLKQHGTPKHPRDLSRHECFGYVPALQSRWPFVINGKLSWVQTNGRIQANHGDALLDASIRGLGISYQPTFLTAAPVAAGSLKVILAGYPTLDMGIYAVYPGRRFIPTRVRALVDYMAERIGAEPYWDRPVRSIRRAG